MNTGVNKHKHWPHKHRYTNTPRAKFHSQTYLLLCIPQSDHLRFIQSHLIQTFSLYLVRRRTKINVAAAFCYNSHNEVTSFCPRLSLTLLFLLGGKHPSGQIRVLILFVYAVCVVRAGGSLWFREIKPMWKCLKPVFFLLT